MLVVVLAPLTHHGPRVLAAKSPTDESSIQNLKVKTYSLKLNTYNVKPKTAAIPLKFQGREQAFGDFYGMGSYIAQRYPEEVGPALKRIQASGDDWLREEFTAARLHPGTLKPYYFASYDRVVNREVAKGFHILGLLDYNNTWNGLDHTWMPHRNIRALIKDYVGYVRAVVSHYRKTITYWQVWNEPDLRIFWHPNPIAGDYANLLRQSYDAIKAINPQAKVIIGGPSDADPHAVRFVQRVNQAGGKFDGVAIQPYTPIPGVTLLSQIHQLQAFHKPVWITEMGWAGQNGCPVCGGAQFQARRMATLYLVSALAGVKHLFWYDFRDDGVRATWADHFGLVEYDFSGKAAYRSYELGLYLLNGAILTGVARVTPTLSLYRIWSHSHISFVAWNAQHTWQTLNVAWSGHAITALDSTGDRVGRSRTQLFRLSLPPDAIQYLLPAAVTPPLSLPKGIPVPPGHTR
jgi:hypothetical protein